MATIDDMLIAVGDTVASMAQEIDLDRLVTEFLLNTCLQRRLNPLPNDLALQAVGRCAALVSSISVFCR